jgi:hypothetical protein
MSTLVTLDEGKGHLRLPASDTAQDADVTAKLDAAEAIILDYLNLTPDMRTITAAWTAGTVPLPAKQAILLELGELWRFRGDDETAPVRWTPDSAAGDVDLSPPIQGLLRRIQPKVLA